MKFLTDVDAKMFLIEVGSLDKVETATRDYIPTNEEITSFISKRKRHESALKDHDKSRKAKEGWRRNRVELMRGIKSYHRSTEGKRHHKRLGRFLASRIHKSDENLNLSLEYLKGVTSAKTTLICELEYYHPLTEQIELENLVLEFAIPLLNSIEEKILKGMEISEDEFFFLFDITEASQLVQALANKTGKEVSEIESYWKEIKARLLKDGHKENDDKFYGLLVHILKKKLNLT